MKELSFDEASGINGGWWPDMGEIIHKELISFIEGFENGYKKGIF